ncbi:O-antigen ligase family protein [Micromonospora endolithica]|uniref:O-antigen ligase-related domain-containing protein n=1 Tax=Micromonospora endolithica TaxID=230091 RepID=A0A3A9ZB22_9ACTN|nr:O-antigen ligase family protein [Micromonospora endolithica]RKN45478.1 hypothetical protein D7223_17960 [Micromonospora endolithica]TWJ22796.1 O-antigen/teichoic acid export membrane protein [Micromonospora endolithica]
MNAAHVDALARPTRTAPAAGPDLGQDPSAPGPAGQAGAHRHRRTSNRSLVSATAGTAGTRVGTLLVSLVAGVLAARALGPHGRGLLAVAIASSAVFGTMFAVGLDTANLRLAGRSPQMHRYAARTSVRYALPAGAGAAALWALAGHLGGAPLRLGLDQATFLLALALCPIVLLATLLGAAEIGRGRASTYNLTTIGSVLIYLGGLAALVALDRATPATVLGAYLGGQLTGVAVLMRQLTGGRGLEPPAPAARREYWSSARRGFAPNLAHFGMVRLQVPVIQVLVGATAVGVYSVALALAETLLIVPIALSLILVPTVANGHADWHQVARLAVRSSAVTVLVAVALAGAGSYLVPALYGESFAPAVPVLWALLPGLVVFAAARVAQSYLTATDRPAGTLVAAVAASVAGLGTMLVLVPEWGEVGAGIAASAGFCVYAVVIATVFLRLRPGRRSPATTVRLEPTGVSTMTTATTTDAATGRRTPDRAEPPPVRVHRPRSPHPGHDPAGWLLLAVAAVAGGVLAGVAVPTAAGLPISAPQLVLAVVVTAVATAVPGAGLYGLALLGPVSQVPGLTLPVMPSMVLLAVCCLTGTVLRRSVQPRGRTATLLAAALVMWLLISASVVNSGNSVTRAVAVVAVVAVPLTVLPLVTPTGAAGGRMAVAFAYAAAGVSVVHVLAALRDGPGAGEASTVNHNVWGALLVVALAVLLARLAGGGRGPVRALTVTATAVVIASIGFSYSRSAYLGALAVLLFFALRRPVRSVVWAGCMAGVAMTVGLTSALLPATITERISDTTSGETLDLSSSVRLDLWSAALRMAVDHPVLGVGYLNFNTHLPEYFVPTKTNAHDYGGVDWGLLAHPHNQYLMVLAEVGLIGALLAGVLLAIVVRSVWRGYRAQAHWTAEAALLAIVGVGVTALTGEPLLAPAVLIPFVLLISTATRRSP